MRFRFIALTAVALTLAIPATGANAVDPPPEQPAHVQYQRLACRSVNADEIARLGGTAEHGVVCRWGRPSNRQAAGYKLARKHGDEPRTIVFRTRNLQHNWFLDTDVVSGDTYKYKVGTVASSARIIAVSDVVTVQA